MAVQVIAGCVAVKLVWSGPTRTWTNNLGLKATGTFPVIDLAFANFVHNSVNSALSSSGLVTHLASTTIFERVLVRSLNSPAQPEISSTGTPTAGGGVAEQLPLSLAACVTLRTALAGKSFRGRVYIAGYDEAANTANGRILAAANDAAAAFITSLSSQLNASGMPIAVLSRPVDAVTIPAKSYAARSGQGNVVTAAIVRDTKWESSRRRTGRT